MTIQNIKLGSIPLLQPMTQYRNKLEPQGFAALLGSQVRSFGNQLPEQDTPSLPTHLYP